MKASNNEKYQVPMVAKAMGILKLLSDSRNALTLAEISSLSKVAKVSAFRILQTLRSFGYVERSSDGATYRLGIRILDLCHSLDKNAELRELGLPFLVDLRHRFGESANLAVLQDDEVVFVATVESTASLRMAVENNGRQPIHSCALGKAIAAHTPWEVIDNILRVHGMDKLTDRTIVSRTDFKKELEAVRREGVAYDREEYVRGGWCVAAPVFDYRSQVVAALSMSAPLTRARTKEKQMAAAVKSAAQLLSSKLGCPARLLAETRHN
ncbi:MAG: IclR family transcriptional regulator [Acidobacteriota bacterium]